MRDPHAISPGEFAGTSRYTPTRLLGAGSWGRVYQAYDNERNAFVAVKLLSSFGPEALLRFKREFRALQNVVHPNLVTLYELISETDRWFFTMEYVDGRSFVDYVTGESELKGAPLELPAPALGGPTQNQRLTEETKSATGPSSLPAPRPSPAILPTRKRPALTPQAVARLRSALAQLVDGISALHAAGKLHRDVKPSNVLVTRHGQVLVLDFGLVRELENDNSDLSQGLIVGTPAYMSPEQSAGLPVKEATDWYAVGVLLYKVLAGKLPFEGKARSNPAAQAVATLVNPSQLTEGVPEDLEKLCLELLARDPEARPTGAQLKARLSLAPTPAVELPPPEAAPVLVGRAGLLEQLRGAFGQVVKGKAAVSLIEGESGLGKTALINAFVHSVKQTWEGAVVLSGRCGEAETVPFKAFDSVIDALCVHLSAQPQASVEGLLPRDFPALVRLFPVLSKLDNRIGLRKPAGAAPDTQETRRKGFRALAQLLSRLSERSPLLIVIDDLQWGDADSAALLEALLQPPEVPAVHLVGAVRTGGETSPVVSAILSAARAGAESGHLVKQRLTCFPLEPAASEELASLLLGEAGGRVDTAALAKESRGSPYLIGALTAIARAGGDVRAVTVDAWVKSRVEGLVAPARRLLECLSVANRPVQRLVAWHAAGLDGEMADPSIQLKVQRLVSSSGVGPGETLQLYDARVGAAVREQLTVARQSLLHRLLAEALESTGSADPETLADWWEAAGESERAWRAATQAAAHATTVLAFDRAVRLYDQAIRSAPQGEQQVLKRARADALAGAGRGKDAADAFLELAAAEAPSPTATEAERRASTRKALAYRQRAADQLLTSGRLDEGIGVLDAVMAELGSKRKSGSKVALAEAVFSRLRASLRGLKFELRPAEELDPDVLARVDAYWSAAKGLGLVDSLRSANLQFIHLRLALDCGEPYRVARALALEAGYHATFGVKNEAQCREALSRLREVLAQHPSAHGEGLHALMAGCAALGTGYFLEARALHVTAVTTFEEKCPGMTWELITAQQYLVLSLLQLGELEEMRTVTTEVLASAKSRRDVYALTNFRVRSVPVLRLVDDQPQEVEREVTQAISEFSREGYFIQTFWALNGKVLGALYEGDGARARGYVERDAALVKAAGLTRLQITRVLWGWLQGITALASGKREEAKKVIKALEAEAIPWSVGLATLLSGMLARAGGETERAMFLLQTGAERLETVGVQLYGAAARRRRAELLPEGERAAALADADAWFTKRGVKAPEKFVGSLLPRAL
jgi:eukaryotic-like serine/threonine-protein kinase